MLQIWAQSGAVEDSETGDQVQTLEASGSSCTSALPMARDMLTQAQEARSALTREQRFICTPEDTAVHALAAVLAFKIGLRAASEQQMADAVSELQRCDGASYTALNKMSQEAGAFLGVAV